MTVTNPVVLGARHSDMHSGMDGMDMGSDTMFADNNSALARGYWYIVAGILGFTFVLRIVRYFETSTRLRLSRSRAFTYPTKPRNWYLQAFATATALYREAVAPELYFQRKGFGWLSPPSMGKAILLAIYWAVITYMLTSNAIVFDAYYWERVAFRAAWISVTQVPMVYLLASKSSIIAILSGSSYERLNWLHRWVSRTLLITVTIHGGFFFREWWLADFIELELSIMPMVKYGLGAWFLLVWTTLSTLAPIRQLSYELFVVQHLAAAGAFLWLLWVHVPSYAQYNVWFAVAAVSFDKILLWCLTAWENLSVKRAQKIGHRAELRVVDSNVTEVTIHDIGFTWKAGQHIYLRIPTLGPFEAHPFTIANICGKKGSDSIQLLIKAKGGFTRRLMKSALKAGEGSLRNTTALVTGPFGCLPDWRSFETLVLISASTGASFTMPILESVLMTKEPSCVTRVDILVIVRNRSEITLHLPRLSAAQDAAKSAAIQLNITVAITCPCDHAIREQYETRPDCNTSDDELAVCKCGNRVRSEVLLMKDLKPRVQSYQSSESESSNISQSKEKDALLSEKDRNIAVDKIEPAQCCSSGSSTPLKNINERITISEKPRSQSSMSSHSLTKTTSVSLASECITYSIGSRPDIATFIRTPVEATGGETSVVVCGGRSVVTTTRNCVARLSDDRAVHKGTGAQGIALHTETYCF